MYEYFFVQILSKWDRRSDLRQIYAMIDNEKHIFDINTHIKAFKKIWTKKGQNKLINKFRLKLYWRLISTFDALSPRSVYCSSPKSIRRSHVDEICSLMSLWLLYRLRTGIGMYTVQFYSLVSSTGFMHCKAGFHSNKKLFIEILFSG